MIKRYHEAPISVFNAVQSVTDGDYALVHLFEDNPMYYKMFKEAVAQGRDVILDNSLFELGKAFDGDRYADWINDLKPTWYIVPDAWKDWKTTVEMFHEFVDNYPDLPGKRIGVAQGNTWQEVAACYKEIEPLCDMVAFSLDFSSEYYKQYKINAPYCVAMSCGRHMVISNLEAADVINKDKPHHLLGCGVPQEVRWYPGQWKWLRSIDTCNPVVVGMHGVGYNAEGIFFKPQEKMCNLINEPITEVQYNAIMYNIRMMSVWCRKWEANNGLDH